MQRPNHGQVPENAACFSYTEEQVRAERREDWAEASYLLAECRRLYAELRAAFAPEHGKLMPFAFYADRIEELTEDIEACMRTEECRLQRFLEVKYAIRLLLNQLGGLQASSDWHSPSYTRSSIPEAGFRQMERNVYLRTGGSAAVHKFEEAFFSAYYPMPEAVRRDTVALSTVSGMKALEAALLFSRTEKTLDRLIVQEGYYLEGIDLLQRIRPDVSILPAEELYDLAAEDAASCLLIEPGVTWPIRVPIDLDALFSRLTKRSSDRPVTVILDRTLSAIADPSLAVYAERLPASVTLAVIESGIKYYQFGLEQSNLGFLAIYRKGQHTEETREELRSILNVLSGHPEPALIHRLPRPSWERIESRLARMARNTNELYAFFSRLEREGRIRSVRTSVPAENGYRIGLEPWIGSLLYIQTPDAITYTDYEQLAFAWEQACRPSLHLHFGGSFGFDTMRVNAVESPEDPSDCALRLSVGRDTSAELSEKLRAFERLVPIR